jgi:hypothetical protein
MIFLSRSWVNQLIWNPRWPSSPADFAMSFAYYQKIWSRIVLTAAGGMVSCSVMVTGQ